MAKIAKIFGAVVRQHREKQDHSQEAFAALAGVHRTYMSSIELGKVEISITIADKVAEALGIPLSRLFKEVEKQVKAEQDKALAKKAETSSAEPSKPTPKKTSK